jgi:hypothetical protein
MMNKPELEFILLRGPRTDQNGVPVEVKMVEVKMVKASKTDLTEYSFLRSSATYEEWVPTKELDTYKKAFGVE